MKHWIADYVSRFDLFDDFAYACLKINWKCNDNIEHYSFLLLWKIPLDFGKSLAAPFSNEIGSISPTWTESFELKLISKCSKICWSLCGDEYVKLSGSSSIFESQSKKLYRISILYFLNNESSALRKNMYLRVLRKRVNYSNHNSLPSLLKIADRFVKMNVWNYPEAALILLKANWKNCSELRFWIF